MYLSVKTITVNQLSGSNFLVVHTISDYGMEEQATYFGFSKVMKRKHNEEKPGFPYRVVEWRWTTLLASVAL